MSDDRKQNTLECWPTSEVLLILKLLYVKDYNVLQINRLFCKLSTGSEISQEFELQMYIQYCIF